MKAIKPDKAVLGLCATSLLLPSCSSYILEEYNINENAIYVGAATIAALSVGFYTSVGVISENPSGDNNDPVMSLWHSKNGNAADSTFYESIHKQSEEIAEQYASLFKDKNINIQAVKQFITYNLSGIYGLK